MRAKKTGSKGQRVKGSKSEGFKNTDTLTLGRSDTIIVHGTIKGKRVPSRILEEQIQHTVQEGARQLHIISDGQHGIGGRIWSREGTVKIAVEGPVGQRLGSMGMPGTEIIVKGS